METNDLKTADIIKTKVMSKNINRNYINNRTQLHT